nr:MAG TPA: hypothetical protein [Crassvirales sp.]
MIYDECDRQALVVYAGYKSKMTRRWSKSLSRNTTRNETADKV